MDGETDVYGNIKLVLTIKNLRPEREITWGDNFHFLTMHPEVFTPIAIFYHWEKLSELCNENTVITVFVDKQCQGKNKFKHFCIRFSYMCL